MGQSKFNLPLEYKEWPQYFDADNIDEDANSNNALIEQLLKKHKVKTVLDLTCGTGSQVLYLTKHGYEVTGADFSPALLEIARNKARQAKLDIPFIDGDMRTIKVGKFDAVITIWNAIGHLTKAGFEKAMRNINKNLTPGGIYVFDIFNLEAMTDKAVKDLDMDLEKKVGDTIIHNKQHSTLDRDEGRLTSYDHYTITKKGESPIKRDHKFTLQIYNADTLIEMLARNGFEVVEQIGFDGKTFNPKQSESVLTIAKKISP